MPDIRVTGSNTQTADLKTDVLSASLIVRSLQSKSISTDQLSYVASHTTNASQAGVISMLKHLAPQEDFKNIMDSLKQSGSISLSPSVSSELNSMIDTTLDSGLYTGEQNPINKSAEPPENIKFLNEMFGKLENFVGINRDEVLKEVLSTGLESVPKVQEFLTEAFKKCIKIEVFQPMGSGNIPCADTKTNTIRIPNDYLSKFSSSEEAAKNFIHVILFETTNCLNAEKHNKIQSRESIQSYMEFAKKSQSNFGKGSQIDNLNYHAQLIYATKIISIETSGALRVAEMCEEAQKIGLTKFPHPYKVELDKYKQLTDTGKSKVEAIKEMAQHSLFIPNGSSSGNHFNVYSQHFIQLKKKYGLTFG